MTEESNRIVEALRHVGNGLAQGDTNTSKCPMQEIPIGELECGSDCPTTLMLMAADLIEHMASVAEDSSAKAALCETVMEGYDKMRRERDAAIADLKDALDRGDAASFCEFCKHNDDWGKCEHPCNPYSGETGWEWRGLPEPPEEEVRE